MTNKQILEQAINKAIEGGWDYLAFEYKDEPGFQKKSHENYDEQRQMFITDWQSEIPAYSLIFNHDFAKALWTDEIAFCDACHRHHIHFSDCDCGVGNNQSMYEHHLQQMVIADDPIKYLGENI